MWRKRILYPPISTRSSSVSKFTASPLHLDPLIQSVSTIYPTTASPGQNVTRLVTSFSDVRGTSTEGVVLVIRRSWVRIPALCHFIGLRQSARKKTFTNAATQQYWVLYNLSHAYFSFYFFSPSLSRTIHISLSNHFCLSLTLYSLF